jgi:predicted metal-dependent phosphoesterase TrpH
MKVKADFHAHTSADPIDDITYSPYEYIDAATKKGFKVIAITHHYFQNFDTKWIAYGKKKKILVIPGLEATVEGQDVLLLNPTRDNITTWKELEEEKQKGQCITILAHPFWYPKNLLWPWRLDKYAHLFDAVEISWLQTSVIRLPNFLAKRYAKKHNKPLIGNGDIHKLEWIGNTYSEVIVKKITQEEVFEAIRAKRVKPVQNKISTWFFLKLAVQHVTGGVVKRKTTSD